LFVQQKRKHGEVVFLTFRSASSSWCRSYSQGCWWRQAFRPHLTSYTQCRAD